MNDIFPRRSVTVDEAVAILLDRADGPIEFRSMTDDVSEEEQEILDGLSYALKDELNNELENLEGLLDEAKYEEQPAAIIEERRIALERHRQLIKQAYAFLAAIEDELSKGKRSALRIDTELSSRAEKYITLISLQEWKKLRQDGGDKQSANPAKANHQSSESSQTITQEPRDIPNPDDPPPDQPWYTAARYFARQLIRKDETLRIKRSILAKDVAKLLKSVGINKRGGRLPFNPDTIRKAFVNVKF